MKFSVFMASEALVVVSSLMMASTALAECKDLVLRMQDSSGKTAGREITMFLNCHEGSYQYPSATTINLFEWKSGQLCHAHRVCGNVKYWNGHFGIGGVFSWGNSVSKFTQSTRAVNDFVKLASGSRGSSGGTGGAGGAGGNVNVDNSTVCVNKNETNKVAFVGPATATATDSSSQKCYNSNVLSADGWQQFCNNNAFIVFPGGGNGGPGGQGRCVPANENPASQRACPNLPNQNACEAPDPSGNRQCSWETGPALFSAFQPSLFNGFPRGEDCRQTVKNISQNNGFICIDGANANASNYLDQSSRNNNTTSLNVCGNDVSNDINANGGNGGNGGNAGNGYSPVFGIKSGESNSTGNVNTDWNSSSIQVDFSLDFGQIERYCSAKKQEVCF